MRQFTEQVNLNTDVIFSNMDRMRFLHLIDDKVKPMIRTDREEKSISRSLEDDDYITRALNHMTNMNQYVLRATIVNEYGDTYSNIKTEQSSYLEQMEEEEEALSWDDKNKIFYTGVYEAPINMVPYALVTSISKIYDIDQDTPIGTLYVDLNFSSVKNILDKALKSKSTGTYLMMFDKEGECIYSTNSDTRNPWGKISEEEMLEIKGLVMEADTEEKLEITAAGEPSVAAFAKNKTTGWKMLVYTPLSSIYASGWKNMVGILIAMAVVLLLGVILGVLLSRQISRPVTILAKAMDKVEQGKVNYIDEKAYYWQDELGDLLRSYNQMGKRINDSIEKIYIYQLNQRQTELKMLQFQINPHFLYNTLNAISSIASLEEINEISKIADNLSGMFQYNIKGKDIVPVQQELNHVKNYLEIQEIRFPGKYKFSYEIAEELYEEPMLKFLLQPLVENSFQHAFGKLKAVNKIILSGERTGKEILLSIYDNGVGMEPEFVKRINEEMRNTDTRTLVTNVDKGIGLRNVNARIKNFYGRDYGIQIDSCLGEYTILYLKIRVLAEE